MTIPLACVGIAFLLIYLPRMVVAAGQAKQPEGYDNKNPRDQQARLTGWAKRAQNAHMNAFEAFPTFAAAVLVSHVTHASPTWASGLAIAHVAARAIYPFMYIADQGNARSAIWFIGFLATAGLFVLPLFG